MNDQLATDIAETTRRTLQRQPQATGSAANDATAPPPEKSNDIAGAGLVFFEQVKALQGDRDRMANELNAANARIEQFQSTVTDLKSRLETSDILLGQARETIDQERAERIRLAAVIEHSVTALSAAVAQPPKLPDGTVIWQEGHPR